MRKTKYKFSDSEYRKDLKMGMESTKAEVKFLKSIKEHPEKVYLSVEGADQEGFEYFGCASYLDKPNTLAPSLKNKIIQSGHRNAPKMIRMMASNMPRMMKGINDSFNDASYLLDRLEKGEAISTDKQALLETYPNDIIWEDIKTYALDHWKVKIGFAKMPEELIFKGKGVLYKNALVCIQEMDKAAIDMAPEMEAGSEVMRVYGTLGIAINDIANYLREKYAIDCHSNHPLGGLVNTVPLAVKAGMGYFGHNGLLITKEFGQRHRIAPIFIDKKIFPYPELNEHQWISEFCKTCRKCERNCPSGAILENKKEKDLVLEGLGRCLTSVDREKCFPYFNKTMGCAVCIKSCPFSNGGETYEKLKNIVEMKNKEV